MQNENNLTRHPKGSLKELSSIAFPLMLSNLSTNLMLFCDRLIVSKTSTHAMNAAVAIGITCSIFHFAISAITSTAEIFVGRYYGAHQQKKIGRTVWQMIWFSLFSIFLFTPIAYFADFLLVQEQYREIGLPFYHWYMFCGPIFPLVMALTSFYIGRGQTKLITIIMIIGNLMNLFFAIVLVLGVKNVVPAFGLKGAAIATISAQSIQALILFCIFIKKDNRLLYHTHNYKFHWHNFKSCLRLGIPMSLGYLIELSSWAFLLRALTTSGAEYMTIFAIGQGLFILFAFVTEGLQKSVTFLVANYLGAQLKTAISKVLVSAIKLQILCAILISIFLICFSNHILHAFTSPHASECSSALYHSLKYSLLWFWLFFICDGIKWVLASMLLALEEAMNVVIYNFVTIWVFAIFPIYFIVGKFQLNPLFTWIFIVIYSIFNAIFLWHKYNKRFNQLV